MQKYVRTPKELAHYRAMQHHIITGTLSGRTSASSQCTELLKEVQLAEQTLTIKMTHFTLRIIIFLFFQRKHQEQMRYG